MSETLTLYKLIILYMLDKVNFPLTNGQISEFIVGQHYTDYFHVQMAISDLLDSKLLIVETIRNTSQYHMSKEGEKTLLYFEKDISSEIKKDIASYLRENEFELRNEVSIIADYYLTPFQEYAVRCRVKEGHVEIIDLTITVPTEDSAKQVCDNWRKNSQEIYAGIIAKLL